MTSPPRSFRPGAFLALARVLTGVAARSAGPIGVPLYFGLSLLASVVFGPNALRASEVTQAALASRGASIALWGAWILVTLPIARAALDAPSTFILRALPAPRWQFLAVCGAHLAAVELPWIALWGRGEGILAGIGAGALAVGAHSILIARSRRPAAIGAAIVCLIAIALPAPVAALLPAGAITAPIGVSIAWRAAPERSATRRRVLLPSHPAAASAMAYLVAIRRGEPGVLGRALLVTVIGGVSAPFAARGQEAVSAASISALSLGIAAATITVAASGLGAAVLRAESSARWLLDSSGIGGGSRVFAASGLTALGGAALGVVHGAVAVAGVLLGPGSGADGGAPAFATFAALSLRLVGLGAAWGATLGVLAAWSARRAFAKGPRKAGQELVYGVAVISLGIAAVAALGEVAVFVAAVVAVTLAAMSARGAATLPEPARAHFSAKRRRA